MLANTPKILLSYAGLLLVLGFALAGADGFHSGWRIVGMNVALGCTIAAVLCHLGSAGDFPTARRAGRALGITLTFAAAINFARLAFKWHGSELNVPLDATIAALMSVTGFGATVLLWRTMRDAIAARWAEHIRQLAAVTGMAAMVGGLAMLKFASTPQAATAFTQSPEHMQQLVNAAADSAAGEQAINAAVNSQAVLEASEQRGISAAEARRLARDPELRAVAIDILQGRAVTPDTLAAEASSAPSERAATPHGSTAEDALLTPEALRWKHTGAMAQHPSEQQMREALLRMNASSADNAHDPAVSAPPPLVAAPHADTRATRPATRITPEPVEQRTADPRLDTRAAGDPRVTNPDDQPARRATRSLAASSASPAIEPAEHFARRSLLDRADPAQQRFMLGSAEPTLVPLRTEPGKRAASPRRTDAETGAKTAAGPTVADARALAESIRSELIATNQHGPLPTRRSWLLDPGLFLTRTGTIALVVGAAVVLCAIAAGKRRSAPPAA